MAGNGTEKIQRSEAVHHLAVEPKSLAILEGGVNTSQLFARAMSALMADLAAGRVSGTVGRAICVAGNSLLRAIDMQHRYGDKGLKLIDTTDAI